MFDITVTIVFHKEGRLCLPALASMQDLIVQAQANNLTVEARALLDRSDDVTKELVYQRGGFLDDIAEVSFGDLGLTRNEGVRLASGRFLAFLDGDDLWGEDWLVAAFREASQSLAPERAIWHPSTLYYFAASDYDNHSLTEHPHPTSVSFYLNHLGTNSPEFSVNKLFINNLWSANVFAAKSLYLEYPYQCVARDTGFGIEDWSWNLKTIWDRIPHLVVQDTVHLIRIKDSGSLGQQNASEGLLVYLEDQFYPNKMHDF